MQNFRNNMLLECIKMKKELEGGSYRLRKMPYFTIFDHGKERHIQSIHVRDRAIQRAICDKVLWPYIQPRLIYDNYACQKGRGITMAIDRAIKHMSDYYKKHGKEGWVLQIDFKSYFENIDQKRLFEMLSFGDPKAVRRLEFIVHALNHKGLDLGSQASQVMAIYYANSLDHFAKEKLHLRHYARYMDDIYAISSSKEELKACLEEMRRLCVDLGIEFSEKKTHISKLGKGFAFLKRRFAYGKNGEVIKTMWHRGISGNRAKLKKLRKKGLPKEDALPVLRSVLGYMESCDNGRARNGYYRLFKELYGDIPAKKHAKKASASAAGCAF